MGEIDLGGALWARVLHPGWKRQYCPRRLVPGLLADMTRRHPEWAPPEISPTDRATIDMPGIIHIGRTWQEIRIDTVSFEIPTWDHAVFTHLLRELTERVFEDGEKYYKLHGWKAAVLFTPEQRDMVLTEMESRCEAVEKQADDELTEILRKRNESEAH